MMHRPVKEVIRNIHWYPRLHKAGFSEPLIEPCCSVPAAFNTCADHNLYCQVLVFWTTY